MTRMNRTFLIAASLVLGTAWSFACGGGGNETNTNTMPTTTATPTMTSTATETTAAMPTASETTTASATTPPPPPKSLFERLGGKDAIAKVTDDFIAIVKDDKRINKFFAVMKDKKKAEALRGSIIDFICKTTGGDCDYKGKDMKTVQAKMKIKDADFDAFMEDLNKALDKNGVGQTEKDEVNTALQGMRADIVTVAAKPGASASAKASASAAPAASK